MIYSLLGNGGFAGGVVFYLLEIFTTSGVACGVIYYLFEIFQNQHRWSSCTPVEYMYYSCTAAVRRTIVLNLVPVPTRSSTVLPR